MSKWEYRKGLHDLGNGIYAYLQPDGSWGLSNAGLIVDDEESILIDTLNDLPLTREMLNAMGEATKAATSIDKLVITHSNPDHYNGNQLVRGAEIISSKACAEEMANLPPRTLGELLKSAPGMGEIGAFYLQCFGQFDFDGITVVHPTRTFENRLEIQVGSKEVHLIEVGPAHTRGDIIVHIPEDRVVFASDILFIGGTPILWAGSVSNWIRACDLMLEMDVGIFVPGHGPITDKGGVEAVKGYLEYIHSEAIRCYNAGLSIDTAVANIDLGKYSSWGETERIVVNIHTLYKEFRGDNSPADILDLFGKMAKLRLKRTGT